VSGNVAGGDTDGVVVCGVLAERLGVGVVWVLVGVGVVWVLVGVGGYVGSP